MKRKEKYESKRKEMWCKTEKKMDERKEEIIIEMKWKKRNNESKKRDKWRKIKEKGEEKRVRRNANKMKEEIN